MLVKFVQDATDNDDTNPESSTHAVGVVLNPSYQSTYRPMYLCVLGLKGSESCQMG